MNDEVSVSKAADSNNTETAQCGSHEGPALNTMPRSHGRTSSINNSNNIPQGTFNIQLPYDINQAMDQDAWDGNFHPISIHGYIEHIASNIKNFKTSLGYMMNYILNKKVEKSKINDLENLKGLGKVAWDFIFAFYDVGWDELIANSNCYFFRQKIVAKFTPKISTPKEMKGNKNKNTNKLISFNRLLSPIPTKLPKEVNKNSKYFKKKLINQKEK